jgi:glycerol-3-phosphate acyltransferase PlsY
LLGLNPWLGAATLLTWVIIAFFFRYSSLASLVAAVFAPFYQALIWGVEPALLAIAAMSLLLVWRHEGNIRKLLAGTESKLGQKAAPAKAAGHEHEHEREHKRKHEHPHEQRREHKQHGHGHHRKGH